MSVKWNPNNPANQTPWNGHQAPSGMTTQQEKDYWAERQHRQTAAFVRNQTGQNPDWYKK